MQKPILYMMLGIPGSGKTSVSEHIAEITGAVHISSDQFRKHMYDNPEHISEVEHDQIYSMLDYIAEQILKSGKSVIYDANLNRLVHRQEKYEICNKIGAKTQLVWVKTDENTARQRATEQADRYPKHRPFGNMKPETFKRLVKQMEPPEDDEKVLIIDGNGISKEKVQTALKSLAG